MANQRTDTQSVVNLVINGKQAMNSLKELTDTQRRLNREVANMKPADQHYEEHLKELQMINEALEERRNIIRGATEETLNWKDIAAGVFGGNLLEDALDGVLDTIGKVTDAFGEAAKTRAVLTNALKGDAKEADLTLKMLMEYAAKTPEGLNEANEAYLKLLNRGIKPTREEMVNIGDVAASQGKVMDQYVEAILDAQSGENERLKELGIRAKKNGDTVEFTFKGITKEVKNTEDAIYKALVGFGELEGVKDTMKTVSDSIVGLRANNEDTWDQIYTKIGQRSEGLIMTYYRTYSQILTFLNENILSTDTAAEKLSATFKDQAGQVNNLEKNVNPLLDRYDELKAKGKLNRDEQTELNSIIKQVSNTIPGAVTQWNNYGDAMGLNTDKAREFIAMQKVLMKAANKEAIDAAMKELHTYTKVRDSFVKDINQGSTKIVSGGGYTFNVKNTDDQIRNMRDQIKKYNELIEERRLLIKGLSGDYLDEAKPPKKDEPVSTARTEGVIAKEIEALKDARKELDVHSKAYAEHTAKIKKLEDELAGARGKQSKAQKTQDTEKAKALTEFMKLGEDYKKLELDRLDAQLQHNALEITQEARKYDDLIKEERKFLEMKGVTAEQRKATQAKIHQIEADKETALANLKVRQEAEMMKKIADLRAGFSKVTATELEKERQQINSFYDGLEKENAGNESKLAELKLARAMDQSDAEIREKKRLEKEKEKIDADYATLNGDKDAMALAKINKQYDDQIKALKEKFSKELQATQEFKDAVDKINGSRTAATEKAGKEAAQRDKDYKIQMVQQAADAAFSIMNNNTKAQLDRTINGYEAQRTAELSKKNLTEKEKKAIEDKYDAKIREAKIKGWEAEKRASIAQAVVNGALAITKVLAQTGVLSPFAIPAIAAGTAAQIAIIAAQETPEFGVGVRNFKGGKAIVGEKGPEAINENGKWWIADQATLTDLEPGTDVYTAADTASMIRNKSLGQRLYSQASYTIDNTAIRNAERNYRSSGNGGYTSTTTAPAGGKPQTLSTSTEIAELREIVGNLAETVKAESEKKVIFVYQEFEQEEKKIIKTRVSQMG